MQQFSSICIFYFLNKICDFSDVNISLFVIKPYSQKYKYMSDIIWTSFTVKKPILSSNTHPDTADIYTHQLQRCLCEVLYEYMDAISLCFTKIELCFIHVFMYLHAWKAWDFLTGVALKHYLERLQHHIRTGARVYCVPNENRFLLLC